MQAFGPSPFRRIGFAPTLPPSATATLAPHHMAWSVVSPRERFVSGPFTSKRERSWDREVASGEQHNLVLDQAYELVPVAGFSRLADYAVVGSGVSSFSKESLGLTSEVARTRRPSSWMGRDVEVQLTGRAAYKITVYREFFEHEVGGKILTEWGYSPLPQPGANLSVAERFLDAGGNPIALTLEPDQRLRMVYSYEVAIFPNRPSPFTISLDEENKFFGSFFFAFRNDVVPLYVLDYLASGHPAEGLGEFTLSLHNRPFPVLPAPAIFSPENPAFANKSLASKPVFLSDYLPGERARRTLPVSFNPEDFRSQQDVPFLSILSFVYGFPEGGLVFTLSSGPGISVDGLHRITFGPLSLSW